MRKSFSHMYEDPEYDQDQDQEEYWDDEYDIVVKKPQISIDKFEKRQYNSNTGKSSNR